MIEFVAACARVAVRAASIIAVAEEDGYATITMGELPGNPIQTSLTYDVIVSELKELDTESALWAIQEELRKHNNGY